MKIVVVHTLDPDSAVAAQDLIADAEAALQGDTPALAMLYAAIDLDHAVILNAIAAHFPDLPLIGCTTDGEASHAEAFQEDSAVLTLFSGEGLRVEVGVARNVSDDPDAAIRDAFATVELVDAPLCIALPESLTTSADAIVRALARETGPDTALVGGTAGDQWSFHQTQQFVGTEVLSDAVPFVLLAGDFEVGVGVASGWQPLGQPAQVTSSDANVVHTIDGEPALSFFHKGYGGAMKPNLEYPIGVWSHGGGFRVRAPMSYDAETGSVTFAGDVPMGATVRLTQGTRDEMLGGCEASVDQALNNLSGPAEALLFFSCAARKQVLGTRTGREIVRVKARTGDIPISGFYTYGEIAPQAGEPEARLHNETFVTLAFRTR